LELDVPIRGKGSPVQITLPYDEWLAVCGDVSHDIAAALQPRQIAMPVVAEVATTQAARVTADIRS
jgi:hypothetical protein